MPHDGVEMLVFEAVLGIQDSRIPGLTPLIMQNRIGWEGRSFNGEESEESPTCGAQPQPPHRLRPAAAEMYGIALLEVRKLLRLLDMRSNILRCEKAL